MFTYAKWSSYKNPNVLFMLINYVYKSDKIQSKIRNGYIHYMFAA